VKKLFNNYCFTSSEVLKNDSLIMRNDIKTHKKNKIKSLSNILLFMFIIINIAICISYMSIDFIKTFYYTLMPDSTMLSYTFNAELFKNLLFSGIGIYLFLMFQFISVVNKYNKKTVSIKSKNTRIYRHLKKTA